MISGPEQARILTEFEEHISNLSDSESGFHHEESFAGQ